MIFFCKKVTVLMDERRAADLFILTSVKDFYIVFHKIFIDNLMNCGID